MRNVESAAVRSETSGSSFWREAHADAYRKLVGVVPKDREKLRAAIEGIMAGSRATVADVLADINGESATQTENRAVAQPGVNAKET